MTPTDSRAIAIGTTVVVVAWVLLRVVPELASRLSVLEMSAEAQALELGARSRELAALGPLSDSISALEAVTARLEETLLVGSDSETAAFDLTRRVAIVVSQSAAWVSSTDPVPDSIRFEWLSRASVVTSLETDIAGLAATVRRIETDPSMMIRALEVEAEDPDVPSADIERLRVQLLVSGWYRAGEGPVTRGGS